MENSESEYDVALSFAGEEREYVVEVAENLQKKGIKFFYDEYENAKLWGKDLYEHLDEIYRKRAKYCVMFISENYKDKLWTNHERRSAQARAFEEKREYILPARFDNTEIPGIRSTIGYVDLTKLTPDKLGELIMRKLGLLETKNQYLKETDISYKSQDFVSRKEKDLISNINKVPISREDYFVILCSSLYDIISEIMYIVEVIPDLESKDKIKEVSKSRRLILELNSFYHRYSFYSNEVLDDLINKFYSHLNKSITSSNQAWRFEVRYYKTFRDEDYYKAADLMDDVYKLIYDDIPKLRYDIIKEIRNLLFRSPEPSEST